MSVISQDRPVHRTATVTRLRRDNRIERARRGGGDLAVTGLRPVSHRDRPGAGGVRPAAGGLRRAVDGVRLAWVESRPTVQVIFQLRFLVGALLGVAGSGVAGRLTGATLAGIALGAAAWLCATWHIYLLNGICDQTEDRHNGSGRPLASGALSLPVARTVAALLAVLAVGLASVLSGPLAIVVAAMLGLGWAYSAGPRPQKATMAGFVVVVTAGGLLTYLAGWLAAVGGSARFGSPGADGLGGLAAPEALVGTPSVLPLVVLAGAMSFWMSLGGMTKDLSDVAGDRAAGRRTLPVVLGDRRARRLMAGFAVAVGVAFGTLAALVAPVLLPAAGILVVGGCAVALGLVTPVSRGDRSRLRLPYRTYMVTQYAVHATVLSQVLA